MAETVTVTDATVTPQNLNAADETFKHELADGSLLICGKPQGILKLKLRQILDDDLLKDQEIKTMAEAFLSIRSVGGVPFQLRTANELEFFMNRFKDEADLDEFLNKYTKLMNPELSQVLDAALDEAFEKELGPDQIKALVEKRALEFEKKKRQRVRD